LALRKFFRKFADALLPFDSGMKLCQFQPICGGANEEVFMSNPSIVIASAGRTAVGSFNGAFATVPAHELGRLRSRARWSAPASMPPKWTR
jgi:hypothetical protein